MVCLDTTLLIDFLDGEKEAVAYMRRLQNGSESITTAAPSVFELVEAAAVARSDLERRQTRELLSSVLVLPLDKEAAWEAGEISATLIHAGQQIGEQDTLIAGIARYHRETIVTRNVKHFKRVPGLEVQKY